MSTYIQKINSLLQPKTNPSLPLVIDLFAGCGGLSLGFEAQGFTTIGVEMNGDACKSYNQNLKGKCQQITFTSDTPLPEGSIIIGGPPCQPFSVGGKQQGLADVRNGFPAFIAAIARYQPQLWLIENVRGLFYRNRSYLEEIIQELQGLNYLVEVKLLNAVDYETPQNRERVFLIGHRGGFGWKLPLSIKTTAGEALGEMATEIPPNAKFLTPNMDAYIAKYEKASNCVNPRDLNLHKPARTLTCRNLAGATGDMQRIRLNDGTRRRLTIREAARLQSFPDWFNFCGSEKSVFNQIGNAVPPMLAYHLAESCRTYVSC